MLPWVAVLTLVVPAMGVAALRRRCPQCSSRWVRRVKGVRNFRCYSCNTCGVELFQVDGGFVTRRAWDNGMRDALPAATVIRDSKPE